MVSLVVQRILIGSTRCEDSPMVLFAFGCAGALDRCCGETMRIEVVSRSSSLSSAPRGFATFFLLQMGPAGRNFLKDPHSPL